MNKLSQTQNQLSSAGIDDIVITPSITAYQMLRILLIPIVLIFIAIKHGGSIESLLTMIEANEPIQFIAVTMTILIIAWLSHLAANHAIDRLGDPLLLQPVILEDTHEVPPMLGEGI
jgi:cephalosporin hydroxylase